jgi:hypothetical protein
LCRGDRLRGLATLRRRQHAMNMRNLRPVIP